jgi:hypothetical protein
MAYSKRKVFLLAVIAAWAASMMLSGAVFAQGTTRNRIDIQNLFTPSGWMGDGEYGRKYINFTGTSEENPHSPPVCIKISYVFGPTRWGGIYWQNQPDNWGDRPGNNYSKRGLRKVTFWARGEKGGEVVEFKAGGIDAPGKKFRDSFVVTIGRQTLSREWKYYEIHLSDADLSSMIGGFCWVASSDYNGENRITFFLSEISLE